MTSETKEFPLRGKTFYGQRITDSEGNLWQIIRRYLAGNHVNGFVGYELVRLIDPEIANASAWFNTDAWVREKPWE